MKQKDIALVAVVVIVSGMLSFFVSRFVFSSPANRQQKAEYVDPITLDFNANLSKKYFNEHSINPTEVIQIGDTTNDAPFNVQ